MNKVLIDYIRRNRVIIFAGSGLSATLQLPTWDQLLSQVAAELKFDADIFQSLGDNYSLAEFYLIRNGRLGNLRQWMDQEWHRPKVAIDISKSQAHVSLVKLGAQRIYTTNWDNWIEAAHRAMGQTYHKIVRVKDIADAPDDVPHIVKFHGDFSDDDSLVFTERSYFDRMSFDSPIDIKFRADTIGRSILFLGYSIRDMNMRLLLYRLEQIWKQSFDPAARPPSFVFLTRPNEVQEAVLRARGIEPIVGTSDDPTHSLTEFLTSLAAAKESMR